MRVRREIVIVVLVSLALIVGAVYYNSLHHGAELRALYALHGCRDYFVVFGKPPSNMVDLVEVPAVTNPDFTAENRASLLESYRVGSVEIDCTVDDRLLACTAKTTRFPWVSKSRSWPLDELDQERKALFEPVE